MLRHGTPVTLLDFVGPSSPPGRVDLRFGQDESGEVYIVTKQDGKIRKLAAAVPDRPRPRGFTGSVIRSRPPSPQRRYCPRPQSFW